PSRNDRVVSPGQPRLMSAVPFPGAVSATRSAKRKANPVWNWVRSNGFVANFASWYPNISESPKPSVKDFGALNFGSAAHAGEPRPYSKTTTRNVHRSFSIFPLLSGARSEPILFGACSRSATTRLRGGESLLHLRQ